MAGPRAVVDAPTFTPLPHGLLSVAQLVPATDPHWQNGVTWKSRCLVDMGAATYDECIAVTGSGGPPPQPSTKTDNVDITFRGATPFTPYVRFDCAPVGNADAIKAAEQALAQAEPWQVERAFWTGLVDGVTIAFPHLAADAEILDAQGYVLQSAATLPVTGSVDPAVGLGLVEEALADCYDGVGVIHVPVRALPTLDAHGLFRVQGPTLRTLNGNLVSAGAGYLGTSPAGAETGAGQAWIYGTGTVFAYRSGVRVTGMPDSLDRSTNTVEMIAERTYVLGWDCCHVAQLIDLGVPTT